MDFEKRRKICYLAILVIAQIAGYNYCLSVFQIPFARTFGWSIPSVAFAYSVLSAVEILVVLTLVNRIRHRLGIRRFVALGGLFFGGGVLACSFIQGSVFELYLYQGAMIGIGNAILVPCLTAYAVQLMPERAGLASGLIVAVYSSGTLLWAPLTAWVIESTGDVLVACRILGAVLAGIIVCFAMLLREIPLEHITRHMQPREADATPVEPSVYDIPRREMVRKPLFYILYLTYFIGILGGTMLLTQGATILEDGLSLPATSAALALGFLAVWNTIGRLASGVLFDKIGKYRVLRGLFFLYLVSFAAMAATVRWPILFIAAAALSFFSFGGFVATLAPLTAGLFGVRHVADNFTIMFTLYSLSGFLAPVIVANIRAISGNYFWVFLIGAGLNLLGLFCIGILAKMAAAQAKKTQNQCEE